MNEWRAWLPVSIAVALIAGGIGFASDGRQAAALVSLGFSLALLGISVGAWLQQRRDEEDKQ